ncbi:Iron-sulfur cluster assembly ATPase protein SufC [Francisella tularensis subsp. tularensis 80700103]|nr:Iron-sulfur cluster assembly ATPase protein SufC [Francisella tularensis subsp. tularensis AS_713]EKM92684.1 Iron-sulfur cluster assembly ATPase protein SufC [Francisella tularensis subsp. tularensis 80700103]EOA43383.1 Iron-sulfur cluster assembly ATPase protein SufC [Francisella tularensis subsp. tularensis 79201237]EOA44823.1 Iron-sulfur cluster assembly ATPase protein SufC [Francisella tularensis subsp. tularensis 80700069]EOA47307.1 Iron-sulfur cluster assembly ATPase protein SufC [Fran
MGPNGAGKSTLSNVLAGKDGYEITQGSITFDGKDLNDLSISERAAAGIFLSLQYPIEIPGVSNVQFLKTALNSIRKQNGEDEIDAISFMKKLKENMQVLKIDQKYMSRGVNEGFSGGEKKRNEMLQLMMLEPKLAILDETDSGLDIDALQVVSQGANSMRSADRSFLVITHYQRLLDHIQPDFVHVLADGKIVKTGGKELALELEEKGYSWLNS